MTEHTHCCLHFEPASRRWTRLFAEELLVSLGKPSPGVSAGGATIVPPLLWSGSHLGTRGAVCTGGGSNAGTGTGTTRTGPSSLSEHGAALLKFC